MERSRLMLVVVLLLVSSRFLTANTKQSVPGSSTLEESKVDPKHLICVSLVTPLTKNITLGINHSGGNNNVTVPLENCSLNHTDALKVEVMNNEAKKLHLKMSVGDCTENYLEFIKQAYVTLENITRHSEDPIICLRARLQPFSEVNEASLCSNASMEKHTNHTSTEPSLTQEEPPTTPPLPASAAVLMAALMVEVVATCIMGGVVVVVIRGVRKTVVAPATTDVRAVSMHDLHICENDLYEPFPVSTAAHQEERTEGDSQASPLQNSATAHNRGRKIGRTDA